MQLVSKYHQRNRFLLCNIDIYNKHALVVPLKKKKKIITITKAFQNFFRKSRRKPNKIWVDKGGW